ncbi:hypothetical protein LCL95_00600 [Bacillus timonensis]|nr:hypothetical protein [Bacillus timonensis]
MYLLLSIFLCSALGFLLMTIGPLAGGVIAFGIVVGCMFRGLFLLNEIHQKLETVIPNKDKVQQAYENYKTKKEEA